MCTPPDLAAINTLLNQARKHAARLAQLPRPGPNRPPFYYTHLTDLLRALECCQAQADNLVAKLNPK